MSLGEKLLNLRKGAGLSQEELAEKLDVSRQTVSKWETDQTVPDLIKAKLLSRIYNISYDSLVSENNINTDLSSIEMIVDEIDWTAAWSKKYPILASYTSISGIQKYTEKISEIYDEFKDEFSMNDVDTVLIIKDILSQKYLLSKRKYKNNEMSFVLWKKIFLFL